ncbi:phospholipase D-like domain-containing protein [Bacillus sp. 31A1R]|uniref:Phospholipase D-like domain-containing protein n=1 Tax=Robertmurraya mangrovi TaxID=3098077 RepID=A0ABU5J484_9BACI|nr:phospholipase D-like domain-containing protein [Bacillus sp. 31A1R]MDZ5474151.1 phospholipase D-like domain-containing protein [Bacillus sp. 31A1R]
MDNIFTNTNKRKDFLGLEMKKYGKNSDILMAVAFFTNESYLQELVNNNCRVKLIVRLGFPTNPISLRKALGMKNVMVRFYTSTSFHPKLYIYGNDIAFLGSSNFTDGGLISNQELNISVDSENNIFEDLQDVFYEYWEEAQVLDNDTLEKYQTLFYEIKKVHEKVEQQVIKDIGIVTPPNDINIRKEKKEKSKEYEQSLLKRYQEYLVKFEELKNTYIRVGLRKENRLPLRIEIHRFLNWVRKNKAYKDLYLNAPVRVGNELESFVETIIREFMNDNSTNFEDEVNSYDVINTNFASEQNIRSLNREELLDTLKIVTAFYEHIRQSPNMSYQHDFIDSNGTDKIKNTLIYLLFGKDDYRKRIANCIYNQEYSLVRFGKSSIQETFGWVNKEEIPICNERAFKSMRWLGYGEFR